MRSQPGDEFFKAKLIVCAEICYEPVRLVRIRGEPGTVDSEKRVSSGERCALVAIEEWVVLGEALPERCGFFDYVGVVPCPRTEKRRFQKPRIANTMAPLYRSIWSSCMARTSTTVR
jgi:hypothetical protein